MRPDDNGRSIEAILDDLYANELNGVPSWDQERGFRATLGNPSSSSPRNERIVLPRKVCANIFGAFRNRKNEQLVRRGDPPRY
jgi:hypothetical protein